MKPVIIGILFLLWGLEAVETHVMDTIAAGPMATLPLGGSSKPDGSALPGLIGNPAALAQLGGNGELAATRSGDEDTSVLGLFLATRLAPTTVMGVGIWGDYSLIRNVDPMPDVGMFGVTGSLGFRVMEDSPFCLGMRLTVAGQKVEAVKMGGVSFDGGILYSPMTYGRESFFRLGLSLVNLGGAFVEGAQAKGPVAGLAVDFDGVLQVGDLGSVALPVRVIFSEVVESQFAITLHIARFLSVGFGGIKTGNGDLRGFAEMALALRAKDLFGEFRVGTSQTAWGRPSASVTLSLGWGAP